ncbi:unnamed protein product [Pieris brassicae]|uniref:Uncharacterized protein n=1 Tax=Pieris brassicae TaxID=7116 RepID=A0A9P0TXQ9_PIEBR|nr:unnamed protein product [Pieris brassicae]
MTCVRCAGEHRAADYTRPRDEPVSLTPPVTRLARSVGRRSRTGVQAHLPEPRRLALCAGATSNRILFHMRLWPLRQRSHPQADAPFRSGVAPKGDEDVFTIMRRRTRRCRRKRRAPPSLAAQEARRTSRCHHRRRHSRHRSHSYQTTRTHAAQPTAPTPEPAATAPPPLRTVPPPRSRTRSCARWPQMEEALSAVANILQAMQAGENPSAASAFKGPTRGRR